MANLNSGTSGYPAALDTSPDLTDGSSGDEIVSAHQDGRGAAIVAIETELGTDPAGSTTDVKTRLAVAIEDNGQIKSSVIVATSPTAVSYAAGVFTISENRNVYQSGNLVQWRAVTVSGFTTTDGFIPLDDTPVQSSEGSGFGLSINLLPTATTSQVWVRGSIQGGHSAGARRCVALFLAGSTSAVTAFMSAAGPIAAMQMVNFDYRVTTVSTATTTYAVRVSGMEAGTYTLNGESGAGLFGNAAESTLSVYEIAN